MPQVPVYDQKQVQQSGLPNVSVGSNVSLETFGGGQSAEAVVSAAQGVSEEGAKIAMTAKRQADQVAFMGADRQASELQTQSQVQLSKMRGQDSFGAPDVLAKQWNDKVSQIKEGLANKQQQMAFERSATKRWDELNKTIQLHVAGEQKQFDEDQTKSYIETSKNAAVVGAKDDDLVDNEIQRQKQVIQQWGARNGLSGTEQEKAKMAEVTSGTMRDVIGARVDAGDTDGALGFLDMHKHEMAAPDVLHALKAVEESKTIDASMRTWDHVKSFRLSDGSPDEARMEKNVMADPDTSDKEKLHILQFVKARGKEEFQFRNQQDNANERTFMNTVVAQRQQGASLEDALRSVNRFAKDDYDSSIKAEAVRKIYAPPEKSDPGTFISLWERIQDKNAEKSDIDNAMQRNLVNAADWRTLREAYYKKNSDAADEKEKNLYERVKILAQEKFGGDKNGAEKFMYSVHQYGNQNKDPAAIWKYANDQVAPDPKTGLSLFGWNTGLFRDPQFKSDVDRMDASNLAWGKIHQDVGRTETNAIGQGILYSGKKSWSVGDVDAFAAQFGGYDKIKAGTPVNNAIQFLVKHNRLVTGPNVKAVMERSNVGSNQGASSNVPE